MLWWILIRFLVNLYRLLLCGILTQLYFLKFDFFNFYLFAILLFFYFFFEFFIFLLVPITIIIQVINLRNCVAILSYDFTGTLPDYLFIYCQEAGARYTQDAGPFQRTDGLLTLSLELLVSLVQKGGMGACELRGF